MGNIDKKQERSWKGSQKHDDSQQKLDEMVVEILHRW